MDAVIRWHKESPKESLQHPRQLRWIFPLESVRLEQVKASEIKESHSTLILPRLWFFFLFIYLFIYLFIFCSIVLDKSVAFGWCFWISFIIIIFFVGVLSDGGGWEGRCAEGARDVAGATPSTRRWKLPNFRCQRATETVIIINTATGSRYSFVSLPPPPSSFPPPLHLKMKKVSSTLHTVAWDDISIVCFSWFMQ